jgi:hypothetical protein
MPWPGSIRPHDRPRGLYYRRADPLVFEYDFNKLGKYLDVARYVLAPPAGQEFHGLPVIVA